MANVTVTDPAGTSVTLPQNVNSGRDGVGKHISGTNGLDSTISDQLIPDLIKDGVDEKVVKCGFTNGKINAMTREFGFKPMKSMKYHYWSVDTRKIKDRLTAAHTITKAEAGRINPARATLTVADATAFEKTDQIIFRAESVNGYTKDGTSVPFVTLNARVCDIKSSTSLEVQFLNANTAGGQVVPANTDIYILGHAAANVEASTVPYAALPEPREQYMQKFMVQSLIESIYQESDKEVDWTKADVNELLLEQLVEDIEKTYIFGVKSETIDPQTKLKTFTTGGILEQMLEGGSKVITLYKDDLSFKDILDAVKATFIGNSGSQKRYMFSGSNVATALWGINDITKMANVKEFKDCFGYDFTGMEIMGYQLVNVPEPLLDKMEFSDYALVLDRQYVERKVFRSLTETAIELKKTGAYDGDSTVWCEISSVILKYPQTHALWHFADGKKPATTTGDGN